MNPLTRSVRAMTLTVALVLAVSSLGLAARAGVAPARAAGSGLQTPAPAAQEVPRDLTPLLAAPASEMRLVVQRYGQDRSTIAGNYFGNVAGGGGRGRGAGRGGGRGGAGAAAPAAPAASSRLLSAARIARLKRFDLEWQSALNSLATTRATSLSAATRTELETLRGTVSSNLAALETEGAARARVMPLLPFAQAIIDLYEARVRMADMDAKAAAGEVTAATRALTGIRASIESGLDPAATGRFIRVDPALANETADSVAHLRAHLTAWFNHYDGYDPLFMWWVDRPYRQADDALGAFVTLLRDRVAPANLTAQNVPAAPAATIPPSAAPAISSVPNLAEIIALPQDEMREVVQRFRSGRGGGGRGRGGAATPPNPQYFRDWLAALNSLNFAALSRNAQVDYLYIRKTSELAIGQASAVPQQNIPRKADNSGIGGAARGRDGLLIDLANELIPYTPEQLIELGNREYVYTVEEMKKASRAMGLGDDWKRAVERVKDMHVEPGRQPEMVRGLLHDAIDYLRTHDLITVPEVARESLRMRMLSPQEQLTAPFFLGGAQILVAYPTNTMDYDTRIQAMRGNNIYFSNAVAHHEMIPGHNLVGFIGSRFNGYRPTLGGTPFLGEGWPLYWETILYDKGFHDTPEKKVGALFWRMHRAARIVFSMNFHMGRWSPQDCIDFLVNEVGHERDNAIAEVRRSFATNYGPLYQMAYLVGGLQIRGIRKELVDSGRMTEKAFHDEILRQGSMPIAYLRLALPGDPLTPKTVVDWPFYGTLPAAR